MLQPTDMTAARQLVAAERIDDCAATPGPSPAHPARCAAAPPRFSWPQVFGSRDSACGSWRQSRRRPVRRILPSSRMAPRTTPPFRADHVGSLLRPPELLKAREDHAAGPDRRRRAAGGRGRGDPRRRRGCRRTSACSPRPTASSAAAPGTWTSSTRSAGSRRSWTRRSRSQFRNADGDDRVHAAVDARRRAGPARAHDLRRRVRRSCRQVAHGITPKLTIPSPSMVHYRGGRAAIDEAVYPDIEEFWADLTAAYAEQVRRLGELGCRYLQLDDTSLAYLNDPAQREHVAAIGGDPEHQHEAYIRHINEALAGRPEGMAVTTHMCRGNFRSSWAAEGGYEFVAEALFTRARGRRLLPRVRRRALRRLRAAALRAEGQAGRARPGHHQARRARAQGRAEAPDRGGRRATSTSTSSASRRSAASPPRSRATPSPSRTRSPSCG